MTASPVIADHYLLTGISVSGFLANLAESWQPILPLGQVADNRKEMSGDAVIAVDA